MNLLALHQVSSTTHGLQPVKGQASTQHPGLEAQAGSTQLHLSPLAQQSLPAQQVEGVAGLVTSTQLTHLATQLSPAQQDLVKRLQALLQPFVLDSRQLSDGQALRQKTLHSGIFMESNLAAGAPASELATDLKTQLFQILNLLQPHRYLASQGPFLQFRDGNLMAARNLLVFSNAKKSKIFEEGLGNKQLEAYEQYGKESCQNQLSDTVLKRWLGQQVEESLGHLVHNQLRCRREAGSHSDSNYWYWELLLQQEGGVQPLPLQLRETVARGDSTWSLQFNLELAGWGNVKVFLTLLGDQVTLSLQTDAAINTDIKERQRRDLLHAFAVKGLQLKELSYGQGGDQGHAADANHEQY
jgi:hypothetical protein